MYFILIKYFIFKHYKVKIGKINKNLKINPYFYVKNDDKLNIIFWDHHFGSKINEFIVLKCNDLVKTVKRNNNSFIFESQNISNSDVNTFNYISFDTNKLYYNFNNNMPIIELKFMCDLKDLEIFFDFSNTHSNTFMSNLQVYDTNIMDINLNFWTPLIYTNLRIENINTNKFKNQFNLFHGGFNGLLNIKYSQLNSFYDKISGVNWLIIQENQFMKLDEKVFSVINNQINKSFTVYINYTIIYKFLDITNRNNLNRNYIYQIKDGSNSVLSVQLTNYSTYTKTNFDIRQVKPIKRIYTKLIDLEDNNHRVHQLLKDTIGVKFFIFTYFKSDKYKYILGFDKDSNFISNNEYIIEENYTDPIDLDVNNINYKNYSHFIGNKQNTIKNFRGDRVVLFYIQINEYAIFNGSDFDEVEQNNNDYYYKINGPIKMIINNNYNLERRINFYSKKKLFECSTFKCNICNIDDICLFCYYNYFLNDKNECILNTEVNKFVNDYSDRIVYNNVVNNHNFSFTSYIKSIVSSISFNDFLLPNVIIFLNFSIVSNGNQNLWNFELNDPLTYNYNIFFENSTINKPITIFLKNSNTFNKYSFELRDNTTFELQLKMQKQTIDCNNLENQLIYKDVECNNLCSINSEDYYYSPFNNKKGYCLKKIENGYYADSENIILKCPSNCKNCAFDNINKIINCIQCIKGYMIIDNNCFFKNEFDCAGNNDLSYNFDNNNEDNIKICDEFCFLCRNKKADKCAINNLNYDFCDVNNIKILIPSNSLLEENLYKCEVYQENKCIKCKNKYFLNDINLCDNCGNDCEKCKNSANCLECNRNSYLEDNICNLCNFKFDNCLKCNINSCTLINEIKIVSNSILCNIVGCGLCEVSNICKICHKNFKLVNNQCICDFESNFYLYQNNCKSCENCSKCILNKISKCPVCSKCNIPIKFSLFQNKNFIFILFNNNIKLFKIDSLIKLNKVKNYNIKFQKGQIEIKILDTEISNTKLSISKNIIQESTQGRAINQTFSIKSFKFPKKIIKNNREQWSINRINFVKINIKNKIISGAIKLTSNTLDYSRFLLFLWPLIILVNQTSLFILLNTTINEDFFYLLKLIKNNNKPFITNEKIIPYQEFKNSYEKIKIKYKNNEIIGNINLIDLNFILIVILLVLFYIVKFVNKKLPVNSVTLFIKNYMIYWKLISLILFQSYLIKYYYKVIFFTEVLFELDSYYLKIYLILWIQFYIIVILIFLNYNYYFCCLFKYIQNGKLYKDYKLIKLFVYYKKRETRNYNIVSNIIDFIIVAIFTLVNTFKYQITLLLLVSLFKLLYCIKLYFIYKKFRLYTQIISLILIMNFYILIFFNHYSTKINSLSNLMIIYFIIVNLWEVMRVVIYKSFKFKKKIHNFSKNNKNKRRRGFNIGIGKQNRNKNRTI